MSRTITAVQHDLNDLVTRHARTDYARLDQNQTVGEALVQLREKPPEGRILYFYVVDQEDHLRGVVPTRRLLLSPLDQRVESIMVKDVIAVPATATVLDACEFFTLHRLLAFPIVDRDRRILGVVDVELYTDELADIERGERNDTLFQLIGVHRAEAQRSSPIRAFQQRFPWLVCNIVGGIAAAFLSGLFEDELEKVVALALFIPVVLSLAESVSIQSVSLSLSILHGKPASFGVLFVKLRAELQTGLLLGLASSVTVAIVASIWLRNWQVALSLLGGITAGITIAAVIGVALPNLLRLLKRDPHVASGPIALTLADMGTLLVYFNLARWLLK